MQSELPLVSAVIPTHRRPKQVIRAIESVLRQTYSPIEVIVVIDGLDDDTRAAVEALRHPSVTCLETGHHVGPAEARNMGIRAAKGIYIGLLDDDDEWTDDKIAIQMKFIKAHALAGTEFLLSGRSVYRLLRGKTRATPKLLYQPPGDLGEYLFHRANPLARPGLIASGTPLFPRSLALRLPFPSEEAHEEVGWWLLCVTREEIPLLMVEDVVLIQHVHAGVARNQVQNWRASLEWARKYHAYMTDVAFAGLLSTTTAWRAKRQQGLRAVYEVAQVMRREGRTRAVHWLTVVGIGLLPLGSIVDIWRRNRP
jgi:glycosyltransferase involved in cell wall biosynthesis